MFNDRQRRRFAAGAVAPDAGLPDGSRLLPRVTPGRRLARDVGCTRVIEPVRYRRADPRLWRNEANEEAFEMLLSLPTDLSNPFWHSMSPPNLEQSCLISWQYSSTNGLAL